MRSAVSENTLPEEVMISVKTLYVLCLFFVFSYSITKSVLHFLEEPTSFEENELEYSLGLVPGNSRAGIPGNFPKIFSPAWSREFFRFPGKFREIFMYCD